MDGGILWDLCHDRGANDLLNLFLGHLERTSRDPVDNDTTHRQPIVAGQAHDLRRSGDGGDVGGRDDEDLSGSTHHHRALLGEVGSRIDENDIEPLSDLRQTFFEVTNFGGAARVEGCGDYL